MFKKKEKKKKQYCNKFNKDFKNGPHQKKTLKKRKVQSSWEDDWEPTLYFENG